MNTFQTQLRSLQDNQKLLGILLFTLITIVLWVGISLITSQKRTAISAESQALAKPLNPSINTEVLDSIELKREYQTTEFQDFPIYIIYNERGNTSIFDSTDQTLTVQPGTDGGLNTLNQPLPTPTPVASGSAQPSPTAVPTPNPDTTTP